MENFTEIIRTGMNNPECAFWVGSSMGSLNQLNLVWILLAFAAYKFIVIAFIEPQATKLKEWIKTRK